MQSIKISNILLPFSPPHLFPLLMLSFQDLKYTLPGLRPFSHPRPRALVVVIYHFVTIVIVTVLILAIVPISNILESNATVTKEFEVHCHYAKVYSQKFWWGILIINASFKTYINVHFNAIAVLPLCHHPNILFYENTHIIWPLPYPSRLPRASSDVVPRDNEAGSNEQHCNRHHWTQEQAHIPKVGIVPKGRNDSLSDETAKSKKQDLLFIVICDIAGLVSVHYQAKALLVSPPPTSDQVSPTLQW